MSPASYCSPHPVTCSTDKSDISKQIVVWQWSGLHTVAQPESVSQSTFSDYDDPVEFRVGQVLNQVRNCQFMGRRAVLAYMRNALKVSGPDHDTFGVIVLHGTSGIGKPQIGIQYAVQP